MSTENNLCKTKNMQYRKYEKFLFVIQRNYPNTTTQALFFLIFRNGKYNFLLIFAIPKEKGDSFHAN